jgi:carboxyl-terminal processing protease
MAGALKSYKRAIVVGADHTYGKGTVQQVQSLPYGLGAAKTTTALFFVPNGETTQHQGVSADVVIPTIWSIDELGEKSGDYSLPPQNISPFVSAQANQTKKWKEIPSSVIPVLQAKSKERVSKNAKFKEIVQELADAQKNKGVVKLADFRKKAKEEKDKEDKDKKKKKTTAQRKKEVIQVYLDEGLNVLSDLVVEMSKS